MHQETKTTRQSQGSSGLSPWRESRVLVTGATGLLGSNLTQELVNRGAQVTCLIRDGIPKSLFYANEPGWGLKERCNVVSGEVEDYAKIERILNEYEIDTVFHLAAQTIVGAANRSPIPTFKANIEGTWNVLEAARMHKQRIKRIIIASSDKAYGNLQGQEYDETFPLKGEHPYDVSKSCADLISRAYFVSYGLPISITRCGNFFGPGDLNFNRLIPGTIQDVFFNRRPVIRSDGRFVRDYIYVNDGAHAYLTLADAMLGPDASKVMGEAFNFSYGLKLSVIDVVQQVLKTLNRTDITPEILNQASNEIPVQALGNKKAQEVLNWKPKFGFEAGMKVTTQWYLEKLAEWNRL